MKVKTTFFVVMIVIGVIAGGWLFLIFGGWPAVVTYALLVGIGIYFIRQGYLMAIGKRK